MSAFAIGAVAVALILLPALTFRRFRTWVVGKYGGPPTISSRAQILSAAGILVALVTVDLMYLDYVNQVRERLAAAVVGSMERANHVSDWITIQTAQKVLMLGLLLFLNWMSKNNVSALVLWWIVFLFWILQVGSASIDLMRILSNGAL